jgi:hypothetical protein
MPRAAAARPAQQRTGCLGGLWLIYKMPFQFLWRAPQLGEAFRRTAATTAGVRARQIVDQARLAGVAAWILAFLFMALVAVILTVMSRGSSDTARDALRQIVASHSSRDLVHVTDQAGSPAVAAAMRGLRAFDPAFDANVFLDCVRVAVGAYAMAQMGGSDRLLRRITTPGFWQTHNGKQIDEGIAKRSRQLRDHPQEANNHRLILDVSWREPAVQAVALGERGVDRITVRLASVVIGFLVIPSTPPRSMRVDGATELDWDFVRPAGSKTDPEAVLQPRTCASCGAPYRSEADDACAYCHAPRADAQAGWRLDRNYLVVQTGR